jgi:hypothetical protein
MKSFCLKFSFDTRKNAWNITWGNAVLFLNFLLQRRYVFHSTYRWYRRYKNWILSTAFLQVFFKYFFKPNQDSDHLFVHHHEKYSNVCVSFTDSSSKSSTVTVYIKCQLPGSQHFSFSRNLSAMEDYAIFSQSLTASNQINQSSQLRNGNAGVL